jgi:hypothetical protein
MLPAIDSCENIDAVKGRFLACRGPRQHHFEIGVMDAPVTHEWITLRTLRARDVRRVVPGPYRSGT